MAAAVRRLCVIFNPAAGARRRRRLTAVLDHLGAAGVPYTVYETRGAGDAESYARALGVEACDAVVAAGGDGTINEILNGLDGRLLPLGIVPLGTANVLALELGLPRDPRGIAEAIGQGRPFQAFAGNANGRRFAVMAGIGFDARVVEALDLRLKRWTGKAAYVASALSVLARHCPVRYAVEIDGNTHSAAAVLIAKGHYYGGRFVIAAEARLEEPCFHVVLFGGSRRVDIVRYALAMGANRVAAMGDVRFFTAREVRVTGPAGERVQLDGDLGPALPLAFTVSEAPVQFLR